MEAIYEGDIRIGALENNKEFTDLMNHPKIRQIGSKIDGRK